MGLRPEVVLHPVDGVAEKRQAAGRATAPQARAVTRPHSSPSCWACG